MKFEKRKGKQLSLKDKSSIGGMDPRIKELCNKLNKTNKYYTTSSCAGRISLIKTDAEKKPGLFILRHHEKITFPKLKKELEKAKKEKEVTMKQETCILHVACKTLEDAQELVDKAKLSGWKKSGIIATKKRFICELSSTETTQLPIISKSKILADEDFLKILIKEMNSKMERTWKKINKLEKMI